VSGESDNIKFRKEGEHIKLKEAKETFYETERGYESK
jgi:hypothetical protein